MKKIINSVLVLLGLMTSFTACEINDPVDDFSRIGQRTPHTYWELSSTKVKAGESLSFKGQYYAIRNRIDRMETWYDVVENITMEASCPIVTFNYTFSISESMLMREKQEIQQYVHKEEYWDANKTAYIFNGQLPVSNTLRVTEWKEVEDFDQEKYNILFPDTFSTAFKKGLFEKLEARENIPSYRAVLITASDFTVEEFNLCLDSVFNENSNSYDKFVKEEKKAGLKAKYDAIPFEELIYKSSDSKYMIDYSKSYFVNATFRVYDEYENEGISEEFKIEIM